MKLNLKFYAPLDISLNEKPDVLSFKAEFAEFIFQALDYSNITNSESRIECPKQMIPSIGATSMIQGAKDSVLAIQSSTVVAFLFSFIFGPAILYLISMLGAIQIIMHIPMMNIRVASNATYFYKILIPIVNYDVLS